MQVILSLLTFVFTLITSSIVDVKPNAIPSKNNSISNAVNQLDNYDELAQSRAMVVGTFHFKNDVLSDEKQTEIKQLLNLLKAYQPTKVIVEWQPKLTEKTNQDYLKFLNNELSLYEKSNEVYQVGFRLAKAMGHKSIFLFDDQTSYEGVLASFLDSEGQYFSFEQFVDYAKTHDPNFYNKHETILTQTFKHNNVIMNDLTIPERFAVMNSPQLQHINAQRMHLFEIRVGIQKNWLGPDWLGRWYRRNIRMMANLIQMAEKGDRLLILVGDNHKWLLDELIDKTPDIKLDSSWDLLKNLQ